MKPLKRLTTLKSKISILILFLNLMFWYIICVELLRLHQMILQNLKMDKAGVIKMEMCGKRYATQGSLGCIK